MNIQIKNTFERVLCQYNKKNNTIKDTVIKAIKEGIDLRFADLRNADLSGADLSYADLRNVDFRNANLRNVDFRNANLEDANLYSANLENTYLSGANLRNANLENANLYSAYISGAKNIPYIPLACPSEGSFIGWKKISRYNENYEGNFIVKLLIPEDAKRSSATTNKCRCNKALVLEITNINNGSNVEVITNLNNNICVYKAGEYVYPDSFDENRWHECSNGIHFFMKKEDAINY